MFQSQSRILTDFDWRRLDALFERIRSKVKPPPTLSVLEREVTQAAVVDPKRVPPTVVTMNSVVEVVDLETEERRPLTVVFPSMAGIESGRVSVLAPLGTALIGSREGANVRWNTPRGPRELRIERVLYQPEASGRFDL